MAGKLLDPGGLSLSLDIDFASFLPVLIKAIAITSGAVMELGTGIYSTPFLHWACFQNKRQLISYENNRDYFKAFQTYQSDFHKIFLTDNFDDILCQNHFDVVFIDHFPQEDRVVQLKKFIKDSNFVILHDVSEEDFLGVSKYRFDYKGVVPSTSVFSNFIDLKDFII